jgi:hypothetical protein
MAHPVIEALQAAHAALDAATIRDEHGRPLGWMSMAEMEPGELNEVVRMQAELEGRVSGLRLHAVAAADASGAADAVAASDTAAWAATAGRNRSRSWGGVWLARQLEETYAHTRAAMAAGLISEEHAAVIVRAAEKVPPGVTPAQLADCEEALVAKAARMSPRNLRRAARRLLEPLSKALADQHEDELVREQERDAEIETWFVLGDNGDGTWSGKFVIPELHGHLLKTVLETLSSPRRHTRNKAGQAIEDDSVRGRGHNYTEALGSAFTELIERLPTDGHGRSPVTLVVHIDEEKLRSEVGVGTLASGAVISNEEVRRLACGAGIMPMVLNGRSVPTDLGRSTRCFSNHQYVALSALHETCAAEGCDRPFAWTELHHKLSWLELGPTDLDNAAPLCGYHHRRVHDSKYEHQWLPDGTVRIRHRWRSRWKNSGDPWTVAAPAA